MDQEQKKLYENTSSSYLSLKAELFRKKQDLNKVTTSSISTPSSSMILDHLQSSSSSLRLKAKADLDVEVATPTKKRKRIDDQKRSPSPTPTVSREDDIAFAKSRAILEAKSKLYAQIMSNSEMRVLAEDDGDEDNDKSFLVDFERKIYDANVPPPKIEFTDSFGRTRLVTPEEYEHLRASDRKESAERQTSNTVEQEIARVERLHREKMRSKWEADMEELRNKTHVHYQDILFDEKRDHGVGFYQFSKDDQQRAEQMATLNELRNKTKTEQTKFQQDQTERHSSMFERLNKMRSRKAKEMGIKLGEEEKPIEPEPPKIPIGEEKPIEPEPPKISIREEKPSPSNIEKPTPKSTEPKSNIIRTAPTGNPNMAYPFPVLRISKSSDTSSSHS